MVITFLLIVSLRVYVEMVVDKIWLRIQEIMRMNRVFEEKLYDIFNSTLQLIFN